MLLSVSGLAEMRILVAMSSEDRARQYDFDTGLLCKMRET